jgi:hypothetical protein
MLIACEAQIRLLCSETSALLLMALSQPQFILTVADIAGLTFAAQVALHHKQVYYALQRISLIRYCSYRLFLT